MKEHEMKPGSVPEGYTKCVSKMLMAGLAFIRKHGLDGLEFKVPADHVGFAANLPPAIPRLTSTDAGRRFLRALEAAAPNQATAFQAICVIDMLSLKTTEWTEQDYAGLQIITKGDAC